MEPMDSRYRHIRFIISVIISPRICWISCRFCKKSLCVQVFSRQITTSKPTKSSYRCNPAMCQSLMPIPPLLSRTSASNPPPRCGKAFAGLQSGIIRFIRRISCNEIIIYTLFNIYETNTCTPHRAGLAITNLRPQRVRTSSLSNLQSVRTVRMNARAHESES